MAATEMNDYIKTTGMDAKIFMLVHDSIVAEVREDQVNHYCTMLQTFTQKDRGVSGGARVPIGIDQEVHEDYSFGKFDDVYGEAINEWFAIQAA
jgi:DNA polymerase I-like protein with 3'-5' exonuclease and polymerase domains